jgi:hypothetical protein
LPLQDGDTVCIIGNALAERMQHDGWVETHIQSQMVESGVWDRVEKLGKSFVEWQIYPLIYPGLPSCGRRS